MITEFTMVLGFGMHPLHAPNPTQSILCYTRFKFQIWHCLGHIIDRCSLSTPLSYTYLLFFQIVTSILGQDPSRLLYLNKKLDLLISNVLHEMYFFRRTTEYQCTRSSITQAIEIVGSG